MAQTKTAKPKEVKESFSPFVTEADEYLFGSGTHYDIYKKLGAHKTVKDGKSGFHFAVWAPNAETVSLVGDFNGWNDEANKMVRLKNNGIYETFVEGLNEGELYKYVINTKQGAD